MMEEEGVFQPAELLFFLDGVLSTALTNEIVSCADHQRQANVIWDLILCRGPMTCVPKLQVTT